MDALNEVLYKIEKQLSAEERWALRRAIAGAADVILTELVNPVLRDFPELEEDEAKWGEIAIEQARRRVADSASRPPESCDITLDFEALLRGRKPDRE
jgi:hypothetical protein